MKAKYIEENKSYFPTERSFVHIKFRADDYDIYITKVNPSGIEFICDNDLKLKVGDEFKIVKADKILEVVL